MRKDLKEKIRNAFEEETPDRKRDVLTAIEGETQYPALPESKRRSFFLKGLAVAAGCLAFFCFGLLSGILVPEQKQTVAKADTFVYLDVNPSLELSLDKNDRVLSCTAANEDAETVLGEMELKGVELKTAVNAIVGSMYINGYLTAEDNSVLISVDVGKNRDEAEFLTYITAQVNEVFAKAEMQCSIIAQSVEADEELVQRAKEKGVSVGKLHLVDKMIDGLEEFNEENVGELVEMSIKELNLLYSTGRGEADLPKDEVHSGKVNGYIDQAELLPAVLTEIGKTLDEVSDVKIRVSVSNGEEKKLVYIVTVRFKDGAEQRFEVDCKTGEITAVKTEKDEPKEEEPEHGEGREPFPENPFEGHK